MGNDELMFYFFFFYIEDTYSNHSIKERVANFMTLFRYVIPDLCSFFEDEEVDLNEWATSWLQHLLAKELQFDDLLRLWGKWVNHITLSNTNTKLDRRLFRHCRPTRIPSLCLSV